LAGQITNDGGSGLIQLGLPLFSINLPDEPIHFPLQDIELAAELSAGSDSLQLRAEATLIASYLTEPISRYRIILPTASAMGEGGGFADQFVDVPFSKLGVDFEWLPANAAVPELDTEWLVIAALGLLWLGARRRRAGNLGRTQKSRLARCELLESRQLLAVFSGASSQCAPAALATLSTHPRFRQFTNSKWRGYSNMKSASMLFAAVVVAAGAGCHESMPVVVRARAEDSSVPSAGNVGQNEGKQENPNESEHSTVRELWALLLAVDEAEAAQNSIQLGDARQALAQGIAEANRSWRRGWMQFPVVQITETRVIVGRGFLVEHTNIPPPNAFVFGHADDELGLESAIAASSRLFMGPIFDVFQSADDASAGSKMNFMDNPRNFLVLQVGKHCDRAMAKQLTAGDVVRCTFDVVGCEAILDGHGVGVRIDNEKATGFTRSSQ
jgi:hypothetical protein